MAVFAPVGSSNTSVTIAAATTPTVANVIMALAATEYSYTFPMNTKHFMIKTRAAGHLQVAYAVGTSGTTFITVKGNAVYGEVDVALSGATIYFQSNEAAQVAEIVSWA